MALRLIEFVVPDQAGVAVREALQEQTVINTWDDEISDGLRLFRVLAEAEQTETILDLLESRFSSLAGFRAMSLPVEATIPRVEKPEEHGIEASVSPARVWREELYTKVGRDSQVTRVHVLLVVLSTFVAAVGLLRNDVAVIIGAMVIAPLLGPNVSLALGTTLGDLKLVARSVKAGLVGMSLALGVSLLLGFVLKVDPQVASIASRTRVGFGDIVLALTSGTVGVLAYTTAVPSAVIGVMVAVALLPPLVVAGLMLASGEYLATAGACLLLLTNLICVNLAGVLTFLTQGVRPRSWWEAEQAKRSTRTAIMLWTILLIILVVLIVIASGRW